MLNRRLLVIQNLLITVPNELQSKDGREELTIDEILEWYLQYRKTATAAVDNNRFGNYKYFSCDIPKGCNPEDSTSFTPQALMEYLGDTGPEKMMAGMLTSLVYDDDLGSFRNAYLIDDDDVLEQRKRIIMDQLDRPEPDSKESEPEADPNLSLTQQSKEEGAE